MIGVGLPWGTPVFSAPAQFLVLGHQPGVDVPGCLLLPHPPQAGWMTGFAYVKTQSSLCPGKLARDLINQDKQSIFSYSPSLEEGVRVLKYAFECITSDSGFWMFLLSHKQQLWEGKVGEAEPRAVKVGEEPLGAGGDSLQLGQLQSPVKDAGVFPLELGLLEKSSAYR